MKRFGGFCLLAGFGALAAGCGGARGVAAAQKGFSPASIKGSYGSIFSGKIAIGGGLEPFDGVGVFIADGKGNLIGHETYNLNGATCSATVQGTYTVAPDGSGTNSITFTSSAPGCASGTYAQSLVVAESGRLALLANTNSDLITEQWRLQR